MLCHGAILLLSSRLATLTRLIFDRESAEHEKMFRLNDLPVNIPPVSARGGSSSPDVH